MKNITFGDLFAGAGGYSIGLRSSGLREVFALESDEWACETLRENLSCKVINADICGVSDKEIISLPEIDILVGGPPCQGFSVAGPSQYGVEDPRNNLFMQFLRFAELKKPYICIIENVPQMLSKKIGNGATAFDAIKSKFNEIGYSVQSAILNSADYGVPQSRNRAFIVASLPGVEFKFPHPTHTIDIGTIPLFPKDHNIKVSVWDAISDLPQIESSEGTDAIIPYNNKPLNDYQEDIRKGSSGITNHIAMKHTQRLIERFKLIKAGQSLKDVALSHGQKKRYSGEQSIKPYKSNNQRLDPNKVCLAIPASFQSNFLHPYRNRNLTAREAARLMSFPDHYIFKGKRTCMSWEKNLSQYNQIGNAVCPLVAKALGVACTESLKDIRRTTFVKPTNSTRITDSVEQSDAVDEAILSFDIAELCFLEESAKKMFPNCKMSKTYAYKGVDIPLVYFPLAIIFATSNSCPLCSPNLPPYATHINSMPFLISKDGYNSLAKKGYDHGLDFHLRCFGKFSSQVAHYVGEVLASTGYATVSNDILNDRTGRSVRGVINIVVPDYIELHRSKLQKIIKNNWPKKGIYKGTAPLRNVEPVEKLLISSSNR